MRRRALGAPRQAAGSRVAESPGANKKQNRSGIQRKTAEGSTASSTSLALDPRPSTRLRRARPRMTRARGGRRYSKRTRRPARRRQLAVSMKRKRSARSAESVPELEGASIALRRRRSFPFEAIWAVPYSASRGTAYSEHRAKSCVRALGRYVFARERSPTPHPNLQTVSRLSAVGRGEVRGSMGEVATPEDKFFHARAASRKSKWNFVCISQCRTLFWRIFPRPLSLKIFTHAFFHVYFSRDGIYYDHQFLLCRFRQIVSKNFSFNHDATCGFGRNGNRPLR